MALPARVIPLMLRGLYTLLLRLGLPVAGALFWWRGRRDPSLRVNLRERLGHGGRHPGPAPIWVHAVSVGEVQAAAGLILQLQRRDPARPILLTMATATGRRRAESLFKAAVSPGPGQAPLQLRYAPFDLPGAAARFLDRVRPSTAVFLETELWPNLLACCAKRGIPVALVSARLSERSLRRYRSFAPRLMRRTIGHIRLIAAQSEADRGRFIALGADPTRVQVTGNIKFDFSLPADLPAQAAHLRERWAAGRRCWVAGSTHAGEERQLLDAHRKLCSVWRGAIGQVSLPLLVLVPRHPDRFDSVAQWLARENVPFLRRSDASAVLTGDTSVLLVDSLGELMAFYSIGEIAFVGGSLVPIGGHNLLEPAALGVPVVSGPANFNSPEAARLLRERGSLQTVNSSDELAGALLALFSDPAERQRRGEAGLTVVTENRGAAARSLAQLEAVLAPRLT